MSDNKLVSTESWELEYLLKTKSKRTTQANKDKLEKIIGIFKNASSYAPHNRESFYKFLAANPAYLNSLE